MRSCFTVLTPTGPAGMNLGNRPCPQKQSEADILLLTFVATIDIQDNRHMMAESKPVLADLHTCLHAGMK